jgi:hypothetical protein
MRERMAGQLNRRRCGRRAALVAAGVVADGTVLDSSASTLRQPLMNGQSAANQMSRPTKTGQRR